LSKDGFPDAVLNPTEAYTTLFNVSETHRAQSVSVGGQTYSFYSSQNIPGDVVYRGQSIAMMSECSPMSRACNLHVEAVDDGLVAPVGFNCSSALNGSFTTLATSSALLLSNKPFYNDTGDTNFFLSYYNDSSLTEYRSPNLTNLGTQGTNQYFVDAQPSHFAVGAQIVGSKALYSDPEIINDTYTGAASFLLKCSAQIVQMNYTYLNGEASDITTERAVDQAIAAITAPWIMQNNRVLDTMTVSLRQAALGSSSRDLANAFARTYGHTVLSMGAGAVVDAPSLEESIQLVRQVTRMPKAPFFILITLNGLYALLGVTLGVLALVQKPKHVKPVQARLSVVGLVAALFEGEKAEIKATKMSQLFAENDLYAKKKVKVSIEPSGKGGWRYSAIEST
jgi:hypothetical protein